MKLYARTPHGIGLGINALLTGHLREDGSGKIHAVEIYMPIGCDRIVGYTVEPQPMGRGSRQLLWADPGDLCTDDGSNVNQEELRAEVARVNDQTRAEMMHGPLGGALAVSVKALIEIRDVIRVWIEFRAPKKGELMWSVPDGSTPEEALEHVLVGRDEWKSGEAGFGYRARADQPEFELVDEGDGPDYLLRYRNIVVHVEYVRTEPKLNNVIPYVKLL